MQQFESVYATSAHPKMSEKYSFVNTGEIIQRFENQGWEIRKISQTKSRDSLNAQFAAHQVRMTHGKFGMVGDTKPEIIISNSHDGKKPLHFGFGLFRLVCSNGLTVPMEGVRENFRVRHMGIEENSVKELTEQMNTLLPTVGYRVAAMQESVVSKEKAIEFLRETASFRWDSGSTQINYDDFLTAERSEDTKMNAWTVFNIAQEKIIGGKLNISKNNKKRRARPITNFVRENELNLKLWETAEIMLL